MGALPLSELTRVRVDPIIAYRALVPDWALDMEATNPFYTWWLVESGGARLAWSGGECRLRPGRAILIPPGLRRHHRFARGTKIVSISFWAGWEDGRVLFPLGSPIMAGPRVVSTMRGQARKLCHLVTGSPGRHVSLRDLMFEPARWLEIRGALDQFVAGVVEWVGSRGVAPSAPDTGDVRLNRVLADLRANLRAGPLPYDRWRELTGLSKVQLDRLARRWLGTTLRHRRDELLFQEIRRDLAGAPDSLKEIAAHLGFFDAAHFSRWVKQRTRHSPRELRGSWV